MLATRRKRGRSRPTIGVDADGPRINLTGRGPTSPEDSNGSRSTVSCDGASTPSKKGTLRINSNNMRSRQNHRFLHTCTVLLVTITLACAVRHAAFVGRINHGGAIRTSPTRPLSRGRNPDSDGGSSRTNAFRSTGGRRLAAAFERGTRFPSLRMAQSSEVQSATSTPPSDVEDEGEWRTVLAAFQMYKAAYGDLKVPSRFVVPGMAPWPELAWKMKLGQRVAAIRATGRYVQNNETRRKALDDMGFLWRLRSPSPGKKLDGISFDQVYDALQMYREQQLVKEGPADGGAEPSLSSSALEVGPNFVVPDCAPWPDSTRGLPLGKIMPTVRSSAYLRRHPGAEARLRSLGFVPDARAAANDLRYLRVRDALAKYGEIHGDLLVPQPFTVPSDGDDGAEEWPEDVRGLRLGARVNAIRSQGTFVRSEPARKEELDAMGFVWEPPADAGGRRRGRKRKDEAEDPSAEDEGGEDAGDAAPPSVFASSASSAPPDTGRDPFFTGDQSTPPRWAFEGEEEEEDDDALLAREDDGGGAYAEKKNFNETMEEMADVAISVGIMERWTSNKRVVKGARDKYVPWRNDDFGADFVFEDVVEALTLYGELEGNFDAVEEDGFVVPAPVQESLRLSPFELAAMDGETEPDGPDGPMDEDWEEDGGRGGLPALATDDWPEHLAGMKLGQIVSRIRDGGLEVRHLPERRKRLEEIGFDWGGSRRFLDLPFEKVMCALYAYFMIRGDTFVDKDFLMPDERPWPRILAGFDLGAAVTRLRELQNFLEAYHPAKVSLLRMVDFSFFPELALPLDPDADETDAEHLYVETFGHPLYHISTVPLGLPERMLADGPDGPPEKLSSWYNYEYVREFHERPGALADVADWMRDIGFYRLAEEHEQKYGRSHYRQLFLLREKLDTKEIGLEFWDQEIDRIKDEVMEEYESWSHSDKARPAMGGVGDGEFDYTINEEEYYYQTLELATSSQDASQFERPAMVPSDVIEESVAEFALGGGGEGEGGGDV